MRHRAAAHPTRGGRAGVVRAGPRARGHRATAASGKISATKSQHSNNRREFHKGAVCSCGCQGPHCTGGGVSLPSRGTPPCNHPAPSPPHLTPTSTLHPHPIPPHTHGPAQVILEGRAVPAFWAAMGRCRAAAAAGDDAALEQHLLAGLQVGGRQGRGGSSGQLRPGAWTKAQNDCRVCGECTPLECALTIP